jgi:RNA polymerase sigma-70 factor, ECF subfamily
MGNRAGTAQDHASFGRMFYRYHAAAYLLGRGGGEDDKGAARAVQKLLLEEALNAMDPIGRVVLTLRHSEQLSNDETATVLNNSRSVISEAYIRALKRITMVLASPPGFKGKS